MAEELDSLGLGEKSTEKFRDWQYGARHLVTATFVQYLFPHGHKPCSLFP
jgi:hypothetical protein